MHNPAPTDREEVLSPSWLSEAIGTRFPGIEVAGVHVVEEQRTLASKLRCTLEYANGAPDDAPRAICIKGFFGSESEKFAWVGEPEARFYSELAPTLRLRMPTCLYAAVDPDNRHGIVVMKDLVAEGCRFLAALSSYTPEQVSATVAQLALLHAQSWDDPRLETTLWLQTDVSPFLDYVDVDFLQDLLDGERGEPLPDAVRRADRLYAGVRQLFAVTEGERRCLVHGDAHAGNLYLTAAGEPGIIDWQILRRGHWSFDVAYHIASALDVSDRERSEQDLVRHYLACMHNNGIELPSWDAAWRSYQIALVYGYNLWAIAHKVDDPTAFEFVRRLGTAVAAHHSFELLDV